MPATKEKTAIKTKILETANQLFNQQGYNNVSMRDIANALQISVGNLTYHYKKKEELVEAAIALQHQNYHKPEHLKTLQELHECFQRVLTHQRGNPYYFHHYKQLAQLSPQIYRIQNTVLNDLHDLIQNAFKNLTSQHQMTPDALENQSENLAQAIITLCAYGTALNGVNVIACIWSLIYPKLTPKGKAIYHKHIEHDALLHSF